MTTRKLSTIALVLVSAAFSATAWAGYRYPVEVQIDAANRTAKGALGSARGSADNNQAIGCRITVNAGSNPAVFCEATDAAGNSASCSSTDKGIVTAATSIRDSSIVGFAWNPSGLCLSLSIENYSSNPPLQP
ncbi:MAG: hypothetical protein MUF34_28425 [Polyangiaceae bacterium]|jgi:hypothetical protein|nr:hypothetical protein [Polyangiaceae bacterium]